MFHIKQNNNLWQEPHATQKDAQDFLERKLQKRFQPYRVDVGVIGLFTEEELLEKRAAEFIIIKI